MLRKRDRQFPKKCAVYFAFEASRDRARKVLSAKILLGCDVATGDNLALDEHKKILEFSNQVGQFTIPGREKSF